MLQAQSEKAIKEADIDAADAIVPYDGGEEHGCYYYRCCRR